jgi:hypothetical protein
MCSEARIADSASANIVKSKPSSAQPAAEMATALRRFVRNAGSGCVGVEETSRANSVMNGLQALGQ